MPTWVYIHNSLSVNQKKYFGSSISASFYIEQDFVLMFGEGVSGKLLEKWTTAFKKKKLFSSAKSFQAPVIWKNYLTTKSPTGDSEEGADFELEGADVKINFMF